MRFGLLIFPEWLALSYPHVVGVLLIFLIFLKFCILIYVHLNMYISYTYISFSFSLRSMISLNTLFWCLKRENLF